MAIKDLKEAEKLFKSYQCNWFYIDRECYIRKDFNALNITNDLYDKWTYEYINDKLDNLDYSKGNNIIYELYKLMGYSLSNELVDRIYNIFIKLYNPNDKHNISTITLIIDNFNYQYNKERPFNGLLGYYYNDNDKIKILANILLNEFKNEDNDCFRYYTYFCLYNIYYNLDYSDELRKLYINKGKEEFEYSLEYGIELWPIIFYLDNKDYINAYKAIRMPYDKFNEVSNSMIANIEFVNEITKLNYTLDDVLKLEPLKDNYKKTNIDIAVEEFLNKKLND